MNVRIYQINMKRDANNVAFMNYESLPKFQGSSEIDSSLYDKVFEGEVNCFTLEKLYEIFNLKHPAGYKGRSMSVSDVVEIIDGNTGKATSTFATASVFRRSILIRKDAGQRPLPIACRAGENLCPARSGRQISDCERDTEHL